MISNQTNNRNSVTVCVCTYRRTTIKDTLESLGKQVNVENLLEEIIVIDNDDAKTLLPTIVDLAQCFPFPLRYVHAPAKNISIARNAALDAVKTRWLAFIDDDELAREDWLCNLMKESVGSQVVIGVSIARYSLDFPHWIEKCDFHSNFIGKSLVNAYTSNALLDVNFVRQSGVRFARNLGRTGGEDTLFFRELSIAGGHFTYAPNAVVDEIVPVARANMRWVLRRMYRAGQTHGLVSQKFDKRNYAILWLTAGAKLGFSTLMAVATLPSPTNSRKWLARSALHAGALSFRINSQILEEYK